jgi:hypothetical protein
MSEKSTVVESIADIQIDIDNDIDSGDRGRWPPLLIVAPTSVVPIPIVPIPVVPIPVVPIPVAPTVVVPIPIVPIPVVSIPVVPIPVAPTLVVPIPMVPIPVIVSLETIEASKGVELTPRMSDKTMKRQKILDKISQKKRDLMEKYPMKGDIHLE